MPTKRTKKKNKPTETKKPEKKMKKIRYFGVYRVDEENKKVTLVQFTTNIFLAHAIAKEFNFVYRVYETSIPVCNNVILDNSLLAIVKDDEETENQEKPVEPEVIDPAKTDDHDGEGE